MELTPLMTANQAVLAEISATEHRTITSLATALGRDKSNLSKSLTALAEAGLVEKPSGAPETDHPAKLTELGVQALAAIERAKNEPPAPIAAAPGAMPAGFVTLEHRQIVPDPDQPRKDFGEKVAEGETNPIEELARSIVLDGLLENLVVRPNPMGQTGDGLPMFTLIAGERRWRAIRWAQEAELLPWTFPIPCNVRDLDEAGVRRVALIENLQRKDLKPIEEARAIEAYRALTGATTEDVAGMLNRTRRFVQRRLQLLQLPADKMKALEAGKITLEEAWRFLDNRPTAPDVPPRYWLIALEVLDKALRDPLSGEKPGPTSDVEVHPHARQDADLKTCSTYPLYLVNGPYDVQLNPGYRRTGRYKVSLSSYGGVDKLKLKFGEEVVTSDERRALAIAEIRSELGIDFPLAEGPSIDWLKGPITVAQSVLDEIAAEEAKSAQRLEQQRQAERAAAERHAAALARIKALEARTREQIVQTLQEDVAEAAEGLGWTLPVFVTPDGSIVDASGASIVHGGYHGGSGPPAALLAKHRLIALGINAAAGLATPEPETASDGLTRPEFVRQVADCIFEDADDLPEDEDEAEFEANARASRGLEALLAEEGIQYGAEGYDWSEDGAMSLAEGIRVDGLGQAAAAAQPEPEGADA